MFAQGVLQHLPFQSLTRLSERRWRPAPPTAASSSRSWALTRLSTHDHSPLHPVLQFPDITWPAVGRRARRASALKARPVLSISGGESLQRGPGEQSSHLHRGRATGEAAPAPPPDGSRNLPGNVPSAIRFLRSALVAATTRASTWISWRPPTRSMHAPAGSAAA